MDHEWMAAAACTGLDLGLFFAAASEDQAIAVCRACPVRTPCLADCLATEDTQRYGVRGGLGPAQRAEAARLASAARSPASGREESAPAGAAPHHRE